MYGTEAAPEKKKQQKRNLGKKEKEKVKMVKTKFCQIWSEKVDPEVTRSCGGSAPPEMQQKSARSSRAKRLIQNLFPPALLNIGILNISIIQ